MDSSCSHVELRDSMFGGFGSVIDFDERYRCGKQVLESVQSIETDTT